MKIAAVLIVLVVGGVIWFLYSRGRRVEVTPAVAPELPRGDEEAAFPTRLRPDEQGFEMVVVGQPSIAKKTIRLRGRFQQFVKGGSQYSTWNQFPRAIQFEILEGPQGKAMLPNELMNISDSNETYERYAQMPSEQIVGQDYVFDLFIGHERYFSTPGRYRLVGEWMGLKTAPVEFELLP